jgi:hypothetical protein
LAASELATNALRHTLSGRDGGWFTVEICFAPGWTRVVVGDRGSDSSKPHIIAQHGLFVVRELSAGWGIDGDGDGRWVWADIGQPAGTARPTAVGLSDAAVKADLARRFPGTVAWWSGRRWWAVPPADLAPDQMIAGPSPGAVDGKLKARYRGQPGNPARPVPVPGISPPGLQVPPAGGSVA